MAFPLLIFTDLDGTLLDHHTYSCQGAAETLRQLRERAIPLILTSSKTKAELHQLQEQLGLHEPFISENGGGIFFPSGHALHDADLCRPLNGYRGVIFGKPYAYIRTVFAQLRQTYNIRGFGDMSLEEIMDMTGLDREASILAAQRDFSEPFIFLADAEPQKMAENVAASDLAVTCGGRFYHLMGAGQDKGRAVAATTRLFQAVTRDKILTVGLGDAQNDLSMLRVVDIPVLIPGPDRSFAEIQLPGLRKASFPGSRGWGEAVADILAQVA